MEINKSNKSTDNFALILLIATIIPFISLPLLNNLSVNFSSNSSTQLIGLLLLLGGTSHVASTTFFFHKKDMFKIANNHSIKFYILPLILILSYALIFQFANEVLKAYALLTYFIWQTYHYQRQNFGVITFISKATNTSSINYFEKLGMQLSVTAGIFALITHYNLAENTFLVKYNEILYLSSKYIFYIIPFITILGLYQISKTGRFKDKLLRGSFTVITTLFFIPAILYDNPLIAVSSYALSHGLQYLIFMLYISLSEDEQISLIKRLSFFIFYILIFGAILMLMSDGTIWGNVSGLIFGIYLGIVMTHFLIDSSISKLAEELQFNLVSKAFPFIKN